MHAMIPATEVRDVLHERLRAVFSSEALLAALGVKAPVVSKGFPVNEPPFYVAVDEICDTAQTSGATSMASATVDFVVHVWCFSEHRDLKVAADTLMAYVGVVFASVIADRTIGGNVTSSLPSVREAGTASNGSKRYYASAVVDVTCFVSSSCPCEIKEIIDELESN